MKKKQNKKYIQKLTLIDLLINNPEARARIREKNIRKSINAHKGRIEIPQKGVIWDTL